MGIRAPNTKRTHSSSTGTLVCVPAGQCGIDEEGAVSKINFGIGLLKVQAGWNLPVFERQDRLDEACHTGSRVQMAKVGFHRTDGTEALLLGMATKSLGQRC